MNLVSIGGYKAGAFTVASSFPKKFRSLSGLSIDRQGNYYLSTLPTGFYTLPTGFYVIPTSFYDIPTCFYVILTCFYTLPNVSTGRV